MTTRSLQLAVNLSTLSAWAKLDVLQSGADYVAPSEGRAIAKDIRMMNMGGQGVAVSIAIVNTTSPQARHFVAFDVGVEPAENALLGGVVVIPAGFSLLARIESYSGYPPLNVTVQASVLEISE